jgi:O-antigen/teichoic acid export membrane protein
MRLYSPSEYGKFAVYFALLLFLMPNAALRYELAIPLVIERREALSLVAVCAIVTLGLALALAAGLCIASGVGIGNRMPISALAWILPVGALASGMNNILAAYATREQLFKDMTRSRISQSACTALLQALLAAGGTGATGLMLGDALGRFTGAVRLARPILRDWMSYGHAIGLRDLLSVSRRYRAFPQFSAPAAALNTAALQVPSVVVLAMYGDAAAGVFSQAQRLLCAPMALFGAAVSQVYLAHMSAALRGSDVSPLSLFDTCIKRLLAFAVWPVVLVCLAAPWAAPVLLGRSWCALGWLATILTPMFVMQILASPLSLTLQILERQRTQCLYDSFRLAAVLATFLVCGGAHLPMQQTVGAYGLAMAASYLVMLRISRSSLRQRTAPNNPRSRCPAAPNQ